MKTSSASVLLLAGLLVALPGCSSCVEGPPAAARTPLDAHHSAGDAVTVANLTVWPVFTDAPQDVGEYLTLQEALAKGVAEVRERGAPPAANGAAGTEPGAGDADGDGEVDLDALVGQVLGGIGDGATVGTLVVENRSDLPILICAGTVVIGGNQDRQIGQDFVVAAGATVPVEAFCVEQGRWRGLRGGEATNGRFVACEVNAPIGVRASAQYVKSQQAVWDEVATGFGVTNFALASAPLPSRVAHASRLDGESSLAAVLEAVEGIAPEALDAYVDAVRAHFDARPDAVGFAYAVSGKAVAVRTFANPALFRRHFDPFLKTMAHEARLAAVSREGPVPAARIEDVAALVASVGAAGETVAATAGANRNGLRDAERGYGSACYVPAGEAQAALTRDWTAK